MQDDERLTVFHISLYISLFNYWNMNHFKNPVVIKRNDLMRASKIGSLNTYTKCLKELHEFDYLNYKPSFNPSGTEINMYTFGTSNYTSKCTGTSAGDDLVSVQLLYINKKKQNKYEKGENVNPTQNEVIYFFKENDWANSEADTFFFHYQSTDWYSGKSKITDWKAAAQKWISNNSNFKNNNNEKNRNNNSKLSKTENLHETTNSNYSEQL